MQKTLIIDYGFGNLTSVYNAVVAVGGAPFVSSDPDEMALAYSIILPGVGSFGGGMEALQRLGFADALQREVLELGKPLLGICLGMQLLATEGTEHGNFKGLNLIPGVVDRLHPTDAMLRVPHIGWDDVRFRDINHLSHNLGEGSVFYFVHSYAFYPKFEEHSVGLCDYGGAFTAAVARDNIYGTQFHPEKSQKAGLQILSNFLTMR